MIFLRKGYFILNNEENSNNELIKNKRCLQVLSRQFKSIQEASTEIINLQAIINLPKGTEHFLSGIHGEYEAFSHVLKNASGVIRRKIENIFGYTLIYNSHGMLMAAHEAFESTRKAIEEEIDIASSITVVETNLVRIRVGDTDIGEKLKEDIEELMMLLEGYRKVMIKSE